MAGVLRVKNWRDFQHYKHRSPPWIKLHRAVLDNREYQALTDGAQALLISIWLIASEGDGRVVADSAALAWRVRKQPEHVDRDLRALLAAGFLSLDGELASTPQAPRLHDAVPEKSRVETEAEQRQSSDTSYPAGAESKSAPHGNGKGENPMSVLMPLVREHLYVHDGKPPEGYNERRDADVLAKLLARYTADDLREALETVGALRRAPIGPDSESLRRWILKQGKLTARVLNDRWGSGAVIEQVLHFARKRTARAKAGDIAVTLGVAL